MKTCALVACRKEEEACLRRNIALYAHLFDDVVILCPEDSKVVLEGFTSVVLGRSGHSGENALERFRLGLKYGSELPCDLIAFTEYDGVFLRRPHFFEGVQTNVLVDADVERWGVDYYCHPPLIFSKQALKRFVWEMTNEPFCEGYGDRWFACQIDRMKIPVLNLVDAGEGFTANTIDERYEEAFKKALEGGAWAIHGVKDQRMLNLCYESIK